MNFTTRESHCYVRSERQNYYPFPIFMRVTNINNNHLRKVHDIDLSQ